MPQCPVPVLLFLLFIKSKKRENSGEVSPCVVRFFCYLTILVSFAQKRYAKVGVVYCCSVSSFVVQ